MQKIDFLDKAMAGRPQQVRAAAIRVLDLYLSAPAWSRDDTTSDRRAELRQILEEAAAGKKKGAGQ
jgi:hypothetical protein